VLRCGARANHLTAKECHVAGQFQGTGGVGKEAIYSLIERNGRVRSHYVPKVNDANLTPILEVQLHGATTVNTDEGATSDSLGPSHEKHHSVNHGIGEYVRAKGHEYD
jgi:hypothetical protein